MSLLELGRALRIRDYAFVTPTPATHARYLARHAEAHDARGVFGWNLPFAEGVLDRELHALAMDAGALVADGARFRARVRYSTIASGLVVHSGFPTIERDAVFFGPDTYRFVAMLERELAPCKRIAEIGCGTAAAAIFATRFADHVIAVDINSRALDYAAINAELAGVKLDLRPSDISSAVTEDVDVVIANPPYLVDDEQRAYRDGGGALGLNITLRILDETRSKKLLVYTATPILAGIDPLRAEVFARFPRAQYAELDPDVFGEDLERSAYAAADRIAVVAIVVDR